MPAPNVPGRLDAGGLNSPVNIYDAAGNIIMVVAANGDLTVGKIGGKVAFYGIAPVALQTGVAVSSAGIHAALVNLNLITA